MAGAESGRVLLGEAMRLLERGWPILPVAPGQKRPRIEWREYQTRLPTEAEVFEWWRGRPQTQIAMATGGLGGVVVVDCDNDVALEAARRLGLTSPIAVRTRHGMHFYHRHPGAGVRVSCAVGANSRHSRAWPSVRGLDLRGDGGQVLVPPSAGYEWAVTPGHDPFDDDNFPEWRGVDMALAAEVRRELMALHPEHFAEAERHVVRVRAEAAPHGEFDFGLLSLAAIDPGHPEDLDSEWRRTAIYVREHFPETLRLPTGGSNARNDRVMRHLAESIAAGIIGEELELRGRAFMDAFFEEPLEERAFKATLASVVSMEQRNNPERWAASTEAAERAREGREVSVDPRPPEAADAAPEPAPARRTRLLQMGDAERLLETAGEKRWLIRPWLAPASIVQIFGYSGSGKSLFLQHALSAMATGQATFGCYDILAVGRVLYLDFEMGQRTVAQRLIDMRSAHGDTGDRLGVWTPWLEGEQPINLRRKDGVARLAELVREARPDVVVIDTIRSAFPGLIENQAEEWTRINSLALSLRNAGMAVVLVHHANKPTPEGPGREAGSSNQLTVLETQVRIAQVFRDREMATLRGGVWSDPAERDLWGQAQAKAQPGHMLETLLEVSYGKVREWTDDHEPRMHIGFTRHEETGAVGVVSSTSPRAYARLMARKGWPEVRIAEALQRPVRTIREWLTGA